MSEYIKFKRLNDRAMHLIKTVEENMEKGVVQTPKNLESYGWAKNTVKEFEAMCADRQKEESTSSSSVTNAKRLRSPVGSTF